MPPELEADIVDIPTAGHNYPAFKPDLEDNQKRWLIVGICLQNIISPTLRTYTEPIILNIYKQCVGIDRQSYPHQLQRYGTPYKMLNYEAINNNKTTSKHQKSMYDYQVRNHVDFSKLFLATNMAIYTAFDETVDISALLGIIINIDNFPKNVQNTAAQVRSNVRNSWAHCNFQEWDSLKYQESFQIMFQLVNHLQLNNADETRILNDLTKWETNGFSFLQGYAIEQDVVQEIRKQTSVLAEYSLKMKTEIDSNFSNVHDAIVNIHGAITIACERIDGINTRQDQLDIKMESITDKVDILTIRTEEIDITQKCEVQKLEETKFEVGRISEKVEEISEEHMITVERVTSLEIKEGKTTEQIALIQSDINDLKQQYMSHLRPSGQVFFYPPVRNEYFVGRGKELALIIERFQQNNIVQHTQAICGLGGCGKTTLSIEFAWRFQQFYPSGVFWMSAESSDALEDSITSLAIDVDTTGQNSKETLKRTLKWLSNLTERWLLVVDNADEEYISDNVKELLLGTWKRNTHGHILITTRREETQVEESIYVKRQSCISLKVLNDIEGVDFMKTRTGFVKDEDHTNIALLVDELGGLPLALEQAAAHIKTIKCSFEDYIKRFQKKRLKLLKTATQSATMSRDRLTVKTTWQLNIDYICQESMSEGLGTAAKTVMEITSFLFPDDIPKELINIGSPVIEDEDINDTLEDEVGLKQVLEILTRFSLFQSTHRDSLSVHRLVQEVIRDSINNEDKHIILLNAIRMVNFALVSTPSPYDALQDRNKQCIKRGSLYMWSKVATNAIVLKGHLVTFANEMKRKNSFFFNFEAIKVLQTTAVFHSLHQRQDKALADQEQMIRIITTVDLSETEYEELTAITIPLLQQDRLIIQNCIASVMTEENDTDDQQISHVPMAPDVLKSKGNEAFQKCKFHDALQYYTEGIRACSEGDIMCKLLSNRSQLYIRIGENEKALADANKCIKLASGHWKAYRSKAYAIAGLIDNGSLPSTMESVGLASASIATYMDKTCLLEFKMKITYPVINYKIVEKPERLRDEIMSMTDRPFITLMLRKGRYTFSEIVLTTKSVQVIGIEDGVEINTGSALCVCRPPKQILAVDIDIEQTIHVHFENIFFVSEGPQIQIQSNSIATFYHCTFSNGNKGCDAFPKCKGDKGCINPPKCKLSVKKAESYPMGNYGTGEPGYPGIAASYGGLVYLESCILDRCGGGGVVSDGEGSLIEMNNCTVRNMRQMGIEARNGGAIKAMNCVIVENQFHGVAIGPQGIGYISGNTIEGNGQEGIWCGRIAEQFGSNSKGGSKSVVFNNVISHNGLSGLSFNGGLYEVKSNKIFENWLWGVMIKSKSSIYLLNNDIFENKCGGIRVGINYSASVLIDGNTIRDHTGPDVYAINFDKQLTRENTVFMHPFNEDEIQPYSRRPIITSTNVRRNNDKGVQHPRNLVNVVKTCCCCHESCNSLKLCSKCKKATYCSKECQCKHWKRHIHLCKLLRESYTVQIQMKDTVPHMDFGPNRVGIRQFDSSLVGIQEGPPPDRMSSKPFIVKIQTGKKEYGYYDPYKKLVLYDRSVTLDIIFSSPVLYHLANECGVLAGTKWTTKTIFCWAYFKNKGFVLCIQTDNLPPFQTW